MIGFVAPRLRLLPKPWRFQAARGLAGSPRMGEATEEGGQVWIEERNAQGRRYFRHSGSGERAWEVPDGAKVEWLGDVSSEIAQERRRLAEERAANEERRRVMETEGKPVDESLMTKITDNFWRLADVAWKGYWVAIICAAVYVTFRLINDYA